MPTVNYSIAATADDASVLFGSLDNTFLAVGNLSGATYGGARFLGVAVPQGATITSATLTLIVGGGLGTGNGTSLGVWRGVASDNAPAWTMGNLGTTSGRTTANTTILGSTTADVSRAHDVAAIVQEIVNRAGWASGNAMAFASDPTGATNYCPYYDYADNPAKVAALSITYSTGGGGSRTGSASLTEAADTGTSTARLAIAGTFSKSEGADTSAATGKLTITGTFAKSEAADSVAAIGTLAILGVAAMAEAADTLASTGTLAPLPIAGVADVTEAADSAAAAGMLLVSATAAPLDSSDTANSSGALSIVGTFAVAEQGDTLAAVGGAGDGITGSLTATESADTVAAAGTLSIRGAATGMESADTTAGTAALVLIASATLTEAGDTGSATAALQILGTLAAGEQRDGVVATALKFSRLNLPVPKDRGTTSLVHLTADGATADTRIATSPAQPSRVATAITEPRVAT